MRHCIIGLIVALVAVMASPSVTAAQELYPGWLTCPNCQTNADKTAFRAESAELSFNPGDLTGVWGQNRIQLNRNAPPMTPDGQARYEATRADETADGQALSNSKDGMLICDPQGWPRWFTYNYGFEFAELPGRLVQFLEWGHTFRTIWTDGRALPEDPDPRWLGYSIGRWEGDTFVVESDGFDERSWLTENRQDRRFGYTHSDALRTEERYRRVDYNTIEVTLTITDPKTFTEPWVTTGNLLRSPNTEIGEYFCVPSDSFDYIDSVLRPAIGPEAEGIDVGISSR